MGILWASAVPQGWRPLATGKLVRLQLEFISLLGSASEIHIDDFPKGFSSTEYT
jgi:hypothetical protein